VRSTRVVIIGSLQKVDFSKKTIAALKGPVVLEDGPSRNRTPRSWRTGANSLSPTCRSS
jgi:hypothetical protein